MSRITFPLAVLLAVVVLGVNLTSGAAAPPDPAAVDKALETLKTYDWGQDRSSLQALDDAVAATHGDAAARKALETHLVAALKTDAPRAAKDVVCRHLSLIGSADAVPALAELLTNSELSQMGRYALERIPDPAALAALREALPKTDGVLKVGVINSLGVRRDADSTPLLAALLDNPDQQIAAAAIAALGAIGSADAAKALSDVQKKATGQLQGGVADARLCCAERLLAAGQKLEAMAIYKALNSEDQPKHVRLAAVRGLLAATGKQ
ncbi:MAG: HEAT repeat domain-containing protein [Pirellulaceae bacterium]|jgi:HEAT repeat protein|nr:HEAT repeat domain-containing protein [Pirellulaceae bacterium]